MAKQGCLFSSKFPPNCPEELKEDTSPILITVKSDELPSSSAALSPSRLPVASLSDQKETALAAKFVKPKTEDQPSPRRKPARRAQAGKKRANAGKRRGQREKRRGWQEAEVEGVTVKRLRSDEKRRWNKKHYCVFCRRPQVKIARHLLRKHADEEDVAAANELPAGSKQRHLLLDHLRCKGNYLHNIEVIRQGSGEIIPWRLPSEEVDARNYLPCPLCLGFFLRADLWKHQVSCRKKTSKLFKISVPLREATLDSADSADDGTSSSTENLPSGEPAPEVTLDAAAVAELPRKRFRVQAEASRFLPISGGASESCSEVLHRMNVDDVSHQVKSDWLICKYGNKLMETQDGNQRRYDYVSQKLRELGRLLLAAKSLNAGVQTLQDLLAPEQLGLAVAAARKASGYRWTCPPLAMKSTLKAVSEIAVEECVQDGDWDAAAKATDFLQQLVNDWDNLSSPDPPAVRAGKPKKQAAQRGGKAEPQEPEVLSQSRPEAQGSTLPPKPPKPPQPLGPRVSRKVRRHPWTFAEKEAVWRQLGVHVLKQSVPGKEACQRCLDLEPDLKGRHWKDIKNQIHNQIQSQKKQQFHAQVDLEGHRRPEDPQVRARQQGKAQGSRNGPSSPAREQHRTPAVDPGRAPDKPQYQAQVEQLDQVPPQKKQLYHLEPPPQLQDQEALLAGALYGADQPLLERGPALHQYPLQHRPLGAHMEQLLSRPDWAQEPLSQHYPVGRALLPDPPPIGAPADPHSGHLHF